MRKWTTLTRRTNDPKLAWLEARLQEAHIPTRRSGESFHAPIMEVPVNFLSIAEKHLDPIDDIPDDDPRFR